MKRALLIFITLSVFSSALNYITYPLLARLLPADQYTDITVSLSLLTQISTFLSSLIAVTIGLAKSGESNDNKIINTLQTFLLQALSAIGIFLLIFAPIVMSLISTPSIYVIPIVLMLIVSVPITVISGYLNGKQKMIKLGLVALTTASFQLVAGTAAALAFQSGVLTMLSMGSIQIISIFILLYAFRDEHIPRIDKSIFKIQKPSKKVLSLLKYTLIASVAIMTVNLLQVVDIIIIKQIHSSTALMYTDVYVVSRALFFAGMIFIWPFLGDISLSEPANNMRIFLKLMGTFILLTGVAIAIVSIFSDNIFSILFGRNLLIANATLIVILSILYKLSLLILTSLTLYFIVLHKYTAVTVATVSCLLIYGLYTYLPHQTTLDTLVSLNIGGGVSCAISILFFLYSLFVERRKTELVKN
jgi:O-antigen/teichoic acid export membrane protein